MGKVHPMTAQTNLPSQRDNAVLVAKTMDARGVESFWEVKRTGRVSFDGRDDWVLLGKPIGARPRKQDLWWMHPSEIDFVWVREFAFKPQTNHE